MAGIAGVAGAGEEESASFAASASAGTVTVGMLFISRFTVIIHGSAVTVTEVSVSESEVAPIAIDCFIISPKIDISVLLKSTVI